MRNISCNEKTKCPDELRLEVSLTCHFQPNQLSEAY